MRSTNAKFDFVYNKQFKFWLAVITALFTFLFLIFFQPFGVNNYKPEESISLLIITVLLAMALLVGSIILTLEFFCKSWLIANITPLKLVLWIAFEIVVASTFTFFFYNIIGGFHDFYFSSYIKHIVQIGTVLTLPVVAVHFYYKHRFTVKNLQEVLSLSTAHHELDELILLRGDYKKDQLHIKLRDIVYIESQDNYIALHYLQQQELKKHLLRATLSKIEERLNNKLFVKCNRAQLVNVIHLHSCKTVKNSLQLNLNKLAMPIRVSRTNREAVLEAINSNL